MSRALLITLAVLAAGCANTASITPTTKLPTTPRVEPTQTLPSTTLPATSTTVSGPTTYLIWASGGLEENLVTRLGETFETVSIVKGDSVELETEDGWVIPLDGRAVEPTTHRPFDGIGFSSDLRPGSVVLGATSAELRSAAEGDELTLGGARYEVAAVVSDEAVGYGEVMFTQSDESSPIATDRFALVASEKTITELEDAVRALDPEVPLRIFAEGDRPWLRHADAVLPQVLIKQALGEFSYTNLFGSSFDQDRAFFEEHIVTTDVPVVGQTVCHVEVTEMLSGAMSQLIDEGLDHLIDPRGYAGCWSPRFIRSATGSPAGPSRHAWGAAVDINAPDNPFGSSGNQDPRLVEIMAAWGFTWGGTWLVPDPMHFEYAKLDD